MKSLKKEIFSYIKVIAVGLVLAFLMRNFIFSPYVVKGESMLPNLQEENKLVVNKLSHYRGYERFDIIVFHAPDQDARYVKRIIGLPGDTVEMKNDVLYVNGKAYQEPYLKSLKEKHEYGHLFTGDFTLEELTGYDKVPKGYVFVLGDNRTVSKDSRDFGLLAEDQIIGKAVWRLWPFGEAGKVK